MKTAVRKGVMMLILAVVLVASVRAEQPSARPFVAGSLGKIVQARQGRPFVLGLWSLSCSHCREELALLGQMLVRYPALDLVLVSTDTPEDADAIAATLERNGLRHAESWVFADSFTERLRFEIDRRWQGELPRTYLYAADHSVRAVSGRLDAGELERWIQEQHVAPAGSAHRHNRNVAAPDRILSLLRLPGNAAI